VVAVPDTPLKARAAFHRALCAQATGNLDVAERLLRTAIAADADFVDAYLVLGTVLEARGKFEDAGQAYKEVLRSRPDSLIAMLRFGISAMRAGFTDTATTYLHRVVDTAPQSLEAVEAEKYLVLME
jgi:Tfp pilus assembly protein PilF